MPKDKPETLKDGEPWRLKAGTVYAQICCDCNLVHIITVESLGEGEVALRFYRDDWQTERLRKKKRRKKRKKKCRGQ